MRSRIEEFKYLCSNVQPYKNLVTRLTLREIEECLKFIEVNNHLNYDLFEEKRKRFAYERPIKTINISEMLELIYAANLVTRDAMTSESVNV